MAEPETESFTRVAPWYDALMAGVPYEQWVRYLLELLERFESQPKTILDLACGTGRVSRLLEQKGFAVTGADASPGMIAAAREKSPASIAYHVGRMESLSLETTFDLVVSFFDSLNYLTDPDDLSRCFERVRDHLNPGGLFIFDMNGVYAFEADLFSQKSFGRYHTVEYDWKSRYDPQTRICRVEMEFFVKGENGKEAFQEVHVQRAYAVEEVNARLQKAGLDRLAVYDAYTTEPVRPKSDRIFWVTRRPHP